MKSTNDVIYLAEVPYDTHGAHGVWATREAAIEHLDQCHDCHVYGMKLGDHDEFLGTGVEIFYWWCENCGNTGRSDIKRPLHFEGKPFGDLFCSEVCLKETQEFYESGKRGSACHTTRQVKERWPNGTEGVAGFAGLERNLPRIGEPR